MQLLFLDYFVSDRPVLLLRLNFLIYITLYFGFQTGVPHRYVFQAIKGLFQLFYEIKFTHKYTFKLIDKSLGY